MKNLIFLIILIFSISIFAQNENRYYVKNETDTLKIAPEGNTIGTLKQFCEVEIIEEQGNWAKIKLTGWTKKENLSLIKKEPFNAGRDFYYQKLNIYKDEFYSGTRITGEMVNKSDKNYSVVEFQITIYDKNEKILDTSTLFFIDFETGEREPFSEKFLNIPYDKNNYIEIEYKIGKVK